jgi:hypothetical protein
VRKTNRGMRGWRSTSGLHLPCLAMALVLGASSASQLNAQAVGAEDPASYVLPPRLVQRMCDAVTRVMAAQDALDVALGQGNSVAKAKPRAADSAQAVPAKRPGDASAEFGEMFGALDDLDHAWGALILDFTGGKIGGSWAPGRDSLRLSVVPASSDPDPQGQRELQAWRADLDGARFYIGLEDRVKAGCPILRDRGGR